MTTEDEITPIVWDWDWCDWEAWGDDPPRGWRYRRDRVRLFARRARWALTGKHPDRRARSRRVREAHR